MDTDFSSATRMYVFLLPHAMKLLEGRLKSVLRDNPGARIVTYTFELPGATPVEVRTCKQGSTNIRLYTKDSLMSTFEIPDAVGGVAPAGVASGGAAAAAAAPAAAAANGESADAEPADAAAPAKEPAAPPAFKFEAPDGKGFHKRSAYRKYVFAHFYSFSNKTNEFLCKKAGEIDGQAFNLSRLDNCEVQLLDHSDQVLADYLKDCRVFIGPSAGSVFLRNCENCSITVAAKQLRTRDCKNCRFYVYSKTEPVIEMTEDVEIRRFNGQYEGMEEHFKAANLNIHMNMWDKVFDFSKRDKDLGPEPHFKLMKLVPTAWKATGERTTKRPRLASVTSSMS